MPRRGPDRAPRLRRGDPGWHGAASGRQPMQMTDQALRALVLAAEVAHTLHDKPVSSYHLLFGLAEAEGGARHVLGLGSARLHSASADDARPPFATAKEVVDRAIEQAPAFGHD